MSGSNEHLTMKKLCEMKVKELKDELDRRCVDRTRLKTKVALAKRLEKSLLDEGRDPETHVFFFVDVAGACSDRKTSPMTLRKNKSNDASSAENSSEQDKSSEGHADVVTCNPGNIEGPRSECKEEPVTSTADVCTASIQRDKSQDTEENSASRKIPDVHASIGSSSTLSAISSRTPTESISAREGGEKVERVICTAKNIWVTGLDGSVTRAYHLKEMFSKYGKVLGAKIVASAKGPRQQCYGFVTMADPEGATAVVENLNNAELHGRTISVKKTNRVSIIAAKKIESPETAQTGHMPDVVQSTTSNQNIISTNEKNKNQLYEETHVKDKPTVNDQAFKKDPEIPLKIIKSKDDEAKPAGTEDTDKSLEDIVSGSEDTQSKTSRTTEGKQKMDSLERRRKIERMLSQGRVMRSHGKECYLRGRDLHSQGKEYYLQTRDVCSQGKELHPRERVVRSQGKELHSRARDTRSQGKEYYLRTRDARSQGKEYYLRTRVARSQGKELHPRERDARSQGKELHPRERDAHSQGKELQPRERDERSQGKELHLRERDARSQGKELHPRERDARSQGKELHPRERDARSQGKELHPKERDARLQGKKLHSGERDARSQGRELHLRERDARSQGREFHPRERDARSRSQGRELYSQERDMRSRELKYIRYRSRDRSLSRERYHRHFSFRHHDSPHRYRDRRYRDRSESRRLDEIREMERKNREESYKIEKEKERLRIEKEKLERMKAAILRIEKEHQRNEREKIEQERAELRKRSYVSLNEHEDQHTLRQRFEKRGKKGYFWDERNSNLMLVIQLLSRLDINMQKTLKKNLRKKVTKIQLNTLVEVIIIIPVNNLEVAYGQMFREVILEIAEHEILVTHNSG